MSGAPRTLSCRELHHRVDDERKAYWAFLRVIERPCDIQARAGFTCGAECVAIPLSASASSRAHPLACVQHHAAHRSSHLFAEVAILRLDLFDDRPERLHELEHDVVDAEHTVLPFALV